MADRDPNRDHYPASDTSVPANVPRRPNKQAGNVSQDKSQIKSSNSDSADYSCGDGQPTGSSMPGPTESESGE